MPINPLQPGPVLLTRQIHDAKRAGKHFDIRIVKDQIAYSWATRKEMPEPGKSIVIFQQPDHTAHYALSTDIFIPEGSYGHGSTVLDFVRKANVEEGHPDGVMVLVSESSSGKERFLIRKLDGNKYGKTSWLLKNLSVK